MRLREVLGVPPAEGAGTDPAPERTTLEHTPAPASLAAGCDAAREVYELPDVDEIRHLAERPFNQRASATTGAGEVDNGGVCGHEVTLDHETRQARSLLDGGEVSGA